MKSALVEIAKIDKRAIARISLNDIILSGEISSSKNLVAIKEAPQNITASRGSQYLYFFFLMSWKRKFILNDFYLSE